MPILFRYLLQLFLAGFFRVLGIFVALFFLVDGIESIRRFADKPNFRWGELINYLFLRMPGFLLELVPAMALLATMMVLTRLTRQNEITVMRASGVSIYRVLIPFLLGGVLVATGQTLIQEVMVPITSRSAESIKDAFVSQAVSAPSTTEDFWVRDGNDVIHAQGGSAPLKALLGVTVFHLDQEHRLTSRVEARRGEWREGGWRLLEGVEYRFGPDHEHEVVPFTERPWRVGVETERLLERRMPEPETLPLTKLHTLARQLESEGYDATPYWLRLQRKLADPFTTLTAMLLAFPFSLRLQRLGGGSRILAIGFFTGFGLFVLVDLATALGLGNRLPPWLAAWGPVAFFAGIGGFLLLHLEEEVTTVRGRKR